MTAPAPVGVDDALETLVQQFSDPLACLRELVQNSVDAGSRQVDIRFEHRAGVMTIHVEDYGEGMDRAIIDTRLTRLFSSAKDGDMTKIGRFGIGFVSVFALQPDAVCVDTGRGGEFWRVLFEKDRTFTRIALDMPVDGTRVRIIKAVDAEEFEALRARARAVLTYWCKHVHGDLYFEDALISGPLALGGAPLQVRHVEEGTEVIVGYPEDGVAFAGFYNRGLTLHEGPDQALPGVAFKVSSRYLEHTLTRDNVLHDDQFARAMAIVRRLADRDLPAALSAQLDEAPDDYAWRALARLLAAGALPEGLASRPLFPGVDGGVSVAQARAAGDRLLHTPKPDRLAALRARAGDTVVCAEGAALGALLEVAPAAALTDAWVLPAPPAGDEAPHWAPLTDAVGRLLAGQGAKLRGVRLAHLPETLADVVAITGAKDGVPVPMAEISRLDASMFGQRRVVFVNADHPAVGDAIRLAATEPELAAYLLVKLFLMGERLDPEIDDQLLRRAVEARGAR